MYKYTYIKEDLIICFLFYVDYVDFVYWENVNLKYITEVLKSLFIEEISLAVKMSN